MRKLIVRALVVVALALVASAETSSATQALPMDTCGFGIVECPTELTQYDDQCSGLCGFGSYAGACYENFIICYGIS